MIANDRWVLPSKNCNSKTESKYFNVTRNNLLTDKLIIEEVRRKDTELAVVESSANQSLTLLTLIHS